jgi:hypothetical protein
LADLRRFPASSRPDDDHHLVVFEKVQNLPTVLANGYCTRESVLRHRSSLSSSSFVVFVFFFFFRAAR